MDTVAPRLGPGKPGSMPLLAGTRRLAGVAAHLQNSAADTPASRNALRHTRDVLADLNQCDPQG